MSAVKPTPLATEEVLRRSEASLRSGADLANLAVYEIGFGVGVAHTDAATTPSTAGATSGSSRFSNGNWRVPSAGDGPCRAKGP